MQREKCLNQCFANGGKKEENILDITNSVYGFERLNLKTFGPEYGLKNDMLFVVFFSYNFYVCVCVCFCVFFSPEFNFTTLVFVFYFSRITKTENEN